MDVLLDDDVLLLITINMRPIDLMCLSRTCTRFRKYNPDYQILIKNYLGKILNPKINVNEFILKMEESNGYLSGSIILQILYDEYWNTDIDIIVPDQMSINNRYPSYTHNYPRTNNGRLNQFVYNNNYKEQEQKNEIDQIYELKDKPRQPCRGPTRLRYGLIPATSVKCKCENYVPINFIYVSDWSIFDYIDYYFDFSVCKSLYDGKLLKICDFDGIVTKTTKHNKDFSRYRTKMDHPFPDNLLINLDPELVLAETTKYRIKKYNGRGFTIN
jgi:hypothetical protein